MFNINLVREMANVTDGAAKTVAISEVISGPNGSPDLRGEWWNDYGSAYEHMYTPNSVQDNVANNVEAWINGACDPAKVPCQATAPCWGASHYAASSYHPGGVNVGMVDGSVHFISDEINLSAWQALGSINGNEVISGAF